MAAPFIQTFQSLFGNWQQSKSCSDDFTFIFALQGVIQIVRKAAITAHIKITPPDKQHVQVAQTATSGKIPSTTKQYTLDCESHNNKDAVFGEISGRSRWVRVEDAEEPKVVTKGGGAWIEQENVAWEAHHLSDFEQVTDEKRQTRRVYVKNSKAEELRVGIGFDFLGK
ncbi:hypothetical protein DE146DRAFT_748705 [Phaeosphaeria sp. MPI-PUGE-AT-0046c]|nr:hypothetical protein DE146DRAFT_748705 [Phaeosphaeria sp. MPI-PUGE-AT-0046c]